MESITCEKATFADRLSSEADTSSLGQRFG